MIVTIFLRKKKVTKINLDQESAGPWLHMAWLSQRGASLWSLHDHHPDDDGDGVDGDDGDDGDGDDGFSVVIGNVNFYMFVFCISEMFYSFHFHFLSR